MLPNLIIRLERWKFNKDYGIYVSNLGNFKNQYRKPIYPKINSNGYSMVLTSKGFRFAHRVVLLTWRPNSDAENLTVDHLNHNKRDNSIMNLEWVTREENLRRSQEDSLEEKPKVVRNLVLNNSIKCTLDEIINFIWYGNGQQESKESIRRSVLDGLHSHKKKIYGYMINSID